MQICTEIKCASHVEASQMILIGCRSQRYLTWRGNIVMVEKGRKTRRDGKIAEGRSFQQRNRTRVGKLSTRATSFPFFLWPDLFVFFLIVATQLSLSYFQAMVLCTHYQIIIATPVSLPGRHGEMFKQFCN